MRADEVQGSEATERWPERMNRKFQMFAKDFQCAKDYPNGTTFCSQKNLSLQEPRAGQTKARDRDVNHPSISQIMEMLLDNT